MPRKKIVWTTEQIKLGDLVEWESNPVQLTEHDFEQIKLSIEKFGLVLPLVANRPKTKRSVKRRLIDGHQRKTIMVYAEMANQDTALDVRIPSRKLTERECDELSIRLRKNTGDFDFDILANKFEVDDLLSWGFQKQDLQIEGFDYALSDLPLPDEDVAGAYIVYVTFEGFEAFAQGLGALSMGERAAAEGTKYSSIDGEKFLNKWKENLS